MNLVVYINNTQLLTITGLANQNGSMITGASITGTLSRGASNLSSPVTFADVDGTPGSYTATLPSFSAALGAAQLVIAGTAGGSAFQLSIFCTVETRSS